MQDQGGLGVLGAIDGGGYNDLMGIAQQSNEFLKALTAGGGTDHAALTQGAALRRESLEATLLSVVEEVKHFVLWRKAAKGTATAMVDEFSIQTNIGGYEGGAAMGELDDIAEATGEYARKTAEVKFLAARRRVSVAAEVQSRNGLAGAIALETRNGTKELLRTANWLGYYGDKACSSVEFDGLKKVLVDAGYFTDMKGKPLTGSVGAVVDAAARVWGLGSFGQLTDYLCGPLVQGDLDRTLDPAHRVTIDGRPTDLQYGATVKGIHTSFGDLASNIDPFITEGGKPWIARDSRYAALATAAGVSAAQAVACTATADAVNGFTDEWAGSYYWLIESGNKSGRSSTVVKTNQTAIGTGEYGLLAITESNGGNETYYVVYRSRKNGTNDNADFRECCRIAKEGDGFTAYADRNQNVPGCSDMFLIANTEEALCYRRLLPMTRFPLYPTTKAEHPWAQLLFCYLRVGIPQHHHLIRNIRPTGQTWLPN